MLKNARITDPVIVVQDNQSAITVALQALRNELQRVESEITYSISEAAAFKRLCERELNKEDFNKEYYLRFKEHMLMEHQIKHKLKVRKQRIVNAITWLKYGHL